MTPLLSSLLQMSVVGTLILRPSMWPANCLVVLGIMATLYFSSVTLPRNIKLNAIAGQRTTLLGVAKENKIKIPHECEDGRCGSCLVKVRHLDGHRVKGVTLTDKERVALKSIGKLPAKEEERANLRDIPPTYRLACQTIVTDEDLLVEFTGDPGGA